MFFGAFNHTIDPKGRTSLPAKFRESLAAAGEPRIVLMQYPQVAAALLRTLSRRLRNADELADDLARRPPR